MVSTFELIFKCGTLTDDEAVVLLRLSFLCHISVLCRLGRIFYLFIYLIFEGVYVVVAVLTGLLFLL